MSVSRADNIALDAAIQRALKKEREERGFVDVPEQKVLYICHMVIGKKIVPYQNNDLDSFISYVSKFQKSFPAVPVHIYTYTEVENTPSA